MNLIDGKAVSASVKEQIRAEIERDKLDIGLAVIIVGNNQASRVYVNNKKKLRGMRNKVIRVRIARRYNAGRAYGAYRHTEQGR